MLGMQGFWSRRTLYQLVAYGVVGVYEYLAGYVLFSHIPLPQFLAFGVQSAFIGFTAFLMRKYWVFA
jgi:hypothetical protein